LKELSSLNSMYFFLIFGIACFVLAVILFIVGFISRGKV